jgi:antitoxin (DNA-binding transcriptional repressor) of toxin-antitoxin stability system
MDPISIDVDSIPGLRSLVEVAVREGEIMLTRDGMPIARIVPLPVSRTARHPGSARGMIHMADDFDAMPEDLREFFESTPLSPTRR